MTFAKKLLAISCMISILSFTCLFVPTTKAIHMQQIAVEMDADANPVVIAGVTLIVVVCLVLLWYGISVTTDSTDAQSCLAFVKEKAQEARISLTQLEINAAMYITMIKMWVAEWITGQSAVYDIASNVSGVSGSMSSDNSVFVGAIPRAASYSLSIGTDYSIKFVNTDLADADLYILNFSGGAIYFMSTTCFCDTLDILFMSGSVEESRRSPISSHVVNGITYYFFYYTYNAKSSYVPILSAYDMLPSTPSDFYTFLGSNFASSISSAPAISADIDKKLVIPAAKDVFYGTGDLDDYAIDNPDVIDFGSALSQLQSATGNPALTWDDVIGGVNEGTISASDVLTATDAIPYVLTDSRTGELATSDTPAEYVKPVALTSDLTIPAAADAASSEPYISRYGNDSDSTYKFRLPLYQYFPFCLPWDIYEALSAFDADPVAPVIDLPLGQFFSHAGYDSDYVASIDLGDDQFAKWFSLLRNLECVGIIIGFVLISRKLIHGGD